VGRERNEGEGEWEGKETGITTNPLDYHKFTSLGVKRIEEDIHIYVWIYIYI
jgi:hypothetical protein